MGKSRTWAQRKLPKLYKKHFGICVYCGELTVLVRDVQKYIGFKRKSYTVEYMVNGVLVEIPFGTVDHVLDLALGGTNKWANLVLSCARCNQKKNRAKGSGRT